MTASAQGPHGLAVSRFFFFIAFLNALSGGATRGATIGDIVDAWKRHTAAIKSLYYECEVTRTESVYKNHSNDPFGEPPRDGSPKEEVTLKGHFTFVVAGQKVASRRVAEFWDDQTQGLQLQTHHRAFDGQRNHSLFRDPRVSSATIEEAAAPEDSLSRHIELLPIWLSYSPTNFLERFKQLPLSKIELSKEPWTVGDTQCLQLSIPLQVRPNLNVTFCLYVDAKHDHRPLMWTRDRNGIPVHETRLTYDPKLPTEWRLSEFSTALLQPDPGDELSIKAIVKKCRVNEPLDDALFNIKHPDGTRLNRNGQLFIQEAGKLRPVDEKEFHAPPTSGEL